MSPTIPNRRARILEEATHLFAAHGYRGTSMRQIASAVGLNQGSLYHYFPGKEALLFEIMNQAMDEALAHLESMAAEKGSPRSKVHKILTYYASYYAGRPERLTVLVREMSSLGKEAHQRLLRKQGRYTKLFMHLFEELLAQGAMRPIPPVVATFAFFGMVHHTVTWYRKEGPVSLEELSKILTEIFTCGILTQEYDGMEAPP